MVHICTKPNITHRKSKNHLKVITTQHLKIFSVEIKTKQTGIKLQNEKKTQIKQANQLKTENWKKKQIKTHNKVKVIKNELKKC